MSAEAVETGPATQQRKKPIRTYGRRSAAAAAKEDAKPSTPRQPSPEDTPAPQLPPPNLAATAPPSVECCPKPHVPKSGSILSFFKAKPKTPAPSTSKATTPAPLASNELTSTPPSPPPSGSGQRKRRRLTTRPTFDDDAAGDDQAGKRRKESRDETPEARDGTPINTLSASTTETDSIAITISTQLVTQKKRTAKAPTKEMVQTTLSLAIGEPRPQFIVCKECNMLYNHLNDRDRKDHKRVHMACIRSKNKEVE